MERLTHKQAIKKHIAECKYRMEVIDEFMKRRNADIEGGNKNIFILKTVVSELEQVQQLKERDTAKRPERTNGGASVCQECGAKVLWCYNFCRCCGQRIDKE